MRILTCWSRLGYQLEVGEVGYYSPLHVWGTTNNIGVLSLTIEYSKYYFKVFFAALFLFTIFSHSFFFSLL